MLHCLSRAGDRTRHWAKWLTAALLVSLAVAYPIRESVSLVRTGATDSRGLRTYAPGTEAALSQYLEPRTQGVRYTVWRWTN